MKTKADTLFYLKDKLRKSEILPMHVIYGRDMEQPEKICAEINEIFQGADIVVRSSCSNEDGGEYSNAGHYESVLNVPSDSKQAVLDALGMVLDSYRTEIDDISNEQVLIQKQLKTAGYSGVIFTRDINHNRPYYVITYDDKHTDTVTSGKGGKTVYIAGNTPYEKLGEFRELMESVREIQEIFEDIPLDIEFAISGDGIVIFQVRPFVAGEKTGEKLYGDSETYAMINETILEYHRLCDRLEERNTILSDMAFWNPAEIIGTSPHSLDYSLYRELVTHSSWNVGLHTIGYRMVDGDLMYRLGNKPYISLKQSFLSLIPKELDERLAEKLLLYYEKMLRQDMTSHDKIEFEIVFSSYDFMTEERLKKLTDYGFTTDEICDIKDALLVLTNNAIANFSEIRTKDLRALNGLMVHRENIRNNLKMIKPDVHSLLGYFMELMESIKHYGTPKFARQARLAFMAKSLCLSLTEKGYFSHEETDGFMMSLNTVATEYDRDYRLLQCGELSKEDFDKKYGHLRAGTYDITCDTYRDCNFHSPQAASGEKKPDRRIKQERRLDKKRLDAAIGQAGFTVSADEFESFMLMAMEEREFFKFEFTKSLSLAIDVLINIGGLLGISREDMAYLTVNDIIGTSIYSEAEIGAFWRDIIYRNKMTYEVNSEIILPDVLYDDSQIQVIEISPARPNYITSEIVSAELVVLDGMTECDMEDLSGKIVVVSKADPGYDWIFAAGIKGFITQYGGVASHMAIRCGEFGIPAAIGCGELIYGRIKSKNRVTIDCRNQKIYMEV